MQAHSWPTTLWQAQQNPNVCLPTKHCSLLSHKGAALTPFATSAKNAFFTCTQHSHISLFMLFKHFKLEYILIFFDVNQCIAQDLTSAHLQCCVKDDQFGACWNGIVAAVTHEELGVHVWVRVLERPFRRETERETPAAGRSVYSCDGQQSCYTCMIIYTLSGKHHCSPTLPFQKLTCLLVSFRT